jgi:hypothetical protein
MKLSRRSTEADARFCGLGRGATTVLAATLVLGVAGQALAASTIRDVQGLAFADPSFPAPTWEQPAAPLSPIVALDGQNNAPHTDFPELPETRSVGEIERNNGIKRLFALEVILPTTPIVPVNGEGEDGAGGPVAHTDFPELPETRLAPADDAPAKHIGKRIFIEQIPVPTDDNIFTPLSADLTIDLTVDPTDGLDFVGINAPERVRVDSPNLVAIPAPGALGLIGLAGLAALRRRR